MNGNHKHNALNGYSIVYYGNDWSAENRTSSHHIAKRLGERVPLLYVEVPGIRAPKASGRDLRKLWHKLRKMCERPRAIGTQMWCVTVPQFPFRRLPFVRRLNQTIGRYLVRRALKKLQFGPRISWFTVVHAGPLAGAASEELQVYYCTDNHAALPDVDSAEITRMDEELTRRADQVFVASSTLLEKKRALNPHVTHSPHGVDVRLFSQASEPGFAEAEEVRGLGHPLIGFFGLIEAWIDLDLIAFLARSRPQWTFMLVGRLAVDASELEKLPNVVFAGPQPYDTLPRWARAFDVAIIPYRLTYQVLNANPLKLREYLATGKPVVAVSTPDIDQFAACVRIAADQEEFLQQVDRALVEDSSRDRERRLAAVANMSWDARVEEILNVVARRLAAEVCIEADKSILVAHSAPSL